MASHHHCHPPATTSCCCCCHCFTWCTPPLPDPHLHSTPSQFHHHPPLQPHLHSPHLNSPHKAFFHNHQHQTPYHTPPIHQQNQEDFQHQSTVSSLLRRIAHLESSLLRRQFSASSASSRSIRDAAARTVQTHFRAFLVRRSRTLRQLKDLASIKSTLNALKISLNQNARLDSQAISRRAMNLLLKLDSIQGGDPMIRDGKRSISRDIIQFKEFIDGVTVKRCKISSIAMRNVKCGRTRNIFRATYGDERVLGENLGTRVEKIHGFSMASEDDQDDEEDIEIENPRIYSSGMASYSQNRNGSFVKTPAKAEKSVSFAENGNIYRIFASTHEPISRGDNNSSNGSVSVDNERGIVDNLCTGVQEIRVLPRGNEDDEVANSEDGESSHNIDVGRNARRNLIDEDIYEMTGHYQGENEEFSFSAPLPVKMESRADLMKRKSVKLVK